ncbi:DJ-1/PfpI family protein [Pseudoalteromonas sp. MMG010]|uniref:DJ-1/PfpI family protein n=1 Tax=Pseudoalteromonas sp. MMG010 TaxID=2822685 RepID=UPI001B3A3F15|nr:DJ-1/PfpI family protein [Pseudoalteromonas sp. MMG010]MBQ4832214.1 DJ-1/PfpI family protein [Pseudoalteromonas sp. MMG010]
MNIGIYIYDNAEVLDFSGPFEVFSTASRVCTHNTPFNAFLISQTGDIVTARAGYKVLPNYGFHNHEKIDVLLIAGGDHSDEINKPEVIDWIALQSSKSRIVASVCTGAFLLAKANVIKSHKVTTHWEDIPALQTMFPKLEVVKDVRWVDEENIITSGGISAGIDMSLHLVSKLYSNDLAEKTASKMEFGWRKNKPHCSLS